VYSSFVASLDVYVKKMHYCSDGVVVKKKMEEGWNCCYWKMNGNSCCVYLLSVVGISDRFDYRRQTRMRVWFLRNLLKMKRGLLHRLEQQ
jgi:hypothetical protein